LALETAKGVPVNSDSSAEVLFSVVIPAHNAGKWISHTLASWVAQTDQRFEVIVVDDGSTDDTADVVGRFASSLRLHLLRIPASGGPARPRNLGIAASQAEVIVICDADDLADPRRLERIGAAWKEAGGIPCVLLSDFSEIDADNIVTAANCTSRFGWFLNQPGTDVAAGIRRIEAESIFDALLYGDFHRTCSLAFTRSAFARIGGYDESLSNAQDYDAIVRFALQGIPLIWIAESLGLYRVAYGNISSRPATKTASSRIKVLHKILQHTSTPAQRSRVHVGLAENYESLGYELASRGAIAEAIGNYARAGRYRLSWSVSKGMLRAVYRWARPLRPQRSSGSRQS